MSNINTKVLSGFVELLPQQQFVFDYILNLTKKIYRKHGFLEIDTPVIERSEVLFAKVGNDTQKEIYRFSKGDNDLSLRFDLTVPLSRYVAEHYNDLVFPFKRFHIGKVYRGERAQKGRYREFYQADVDIMSENSLSEHCFLDVVSTIADVLGNITAKFGLGKVVVKISSRKIWDTLFDYLSLNKDQRKLVLLIIDKKEKIKNEEFDLELLNILDEKSIFLIKEIFKIAVSKSYDLSFTDCDTSLQKIINETKLLFYLKNLVYSISILSKANTNVSFILDLSIVRGLDYYTGMVFETFLTDYKELGSIAGGGRYDDLCQYYSNKNISGVGGAIGLSRFCIPLIEQGILKLDENMLDILVIPQNENCIEAAFILNQKISTLTALSSSIIFDDKKFKKLMEYANKIKTRYVIIIGDDEISKSFYTFKNMRTGQQVSYNEQDLFSFLNSIKTNG